VTPPTPESVASQRRERLLGWTATLIASAYCVWTTTVLLRHGRTFKGMFEGLGSDFLPLQDLIGKLAS
jgi:hypothetical protein